MYKALRHGVQIVAVKMFKEEMTRGAINSLTSPHHAMQFRREISILKSCHDKNIVQFLGACLTVRPPLSRSCRRRAGSRHFPVYYSKGRVRVTAERATLYCACTLWS